MPADPMPTQDASLPLTLPSTLPSTLTRIAHLLTAPLPRTTDSRGDQLLERLTAAAVVSVRGADYAGLTMRRRGTLTSRAPSDPHIRDVDQLQVTLAEGPCVDALEPGTPPIVVVDDFVSERRWRRFSPAVAEQGIRSLLSFTMAPHHASPAALNLYSAEPHAFDEVDQIIGAAFAHQASVVVHGAELVTGLERAVQTRDEIGQAKGILIERFGITGERAFDLLVESSQTTNTKLADVAHWLVAESAVRGPGERSRRAPG